MLPQERPDSTRAAASAARLWILPAFHQGSHLWSFSFGPLDSPNYHRGMAFLSPDVIQLAARQHHQNAALPACLPAAWHLYLAGANVHTLHFHFFPRRHSHAHKALSGKNLVEEQSHFFPCESSASSRILRHGGVFTAYVSCRCCRFSGKKKK